jgi:trafficking protein particle complex subunit 8
MVLKIPIALRCSRPALFTVAEVTFKFLSLLPCRESLASRGKRLHATPHQRQNVVYGPDATIKVSVVETTHRLLAAFVNDTRLVAMEGEHRSLDIWVSNQGSKPIDEAWIVSSPTDNVFIDGEGSGLEGISIIVTVEDAPSYSLDFHRIILCR